VNVLQTVSTGEPAACLRTMGPKIALFRNRTS